MERIAADSPSWWWPTTRTASSTRCWCWPPRPRPLRFLAKATLWKVPGLKWLMAIAGVLPVHRASDGDTTGNGGCSRPWSASSPHDGAIAIFPEGTVNDALPLKPAEDRRGPDRPRAPVRRAPTGCASCPSVSCTRTRRGRAPACSVRAGEPIDLDAAARRYFAAW